MVLHKDDIKEKSFFTTIVRKSTKVKGFFKKGKKLENVFREEKYVFVEKQSISKLTHLKSCLSRIDICPKRTKTARVCSLRA